MASLRKKDASKYWFACFTLPNGRRVQRSTKLTDKKRAQKLADELEQTFRSRIAARQSQRVIASIHKELTGSHLPTRTVRSYLTEWLKIRAQETAPNTMVFYRAVVKSFLEFLAGRADIDLTEISSEEILAFRRDMAGKVAASTLNHRLKVLRMIFGQARRDGFLADNPAESVNRVKDEGRTKRRAFTVKELKALLGACDDEWRSLVLFGLYTGQRLGDLALLTWQNIDLQAGEMRLVTRKTGRTQIIPLADPLREHLEALPATDNPLQPLHPRAFADLTKYGKAAYISQDFYGLMASVGIVPPRTHRKKEGPREISPITFHSLRHTATSLMKQAGVGASVVMDLIGHESAAISNHYTHTTDEAKREALNKLPDLR